MQSDYDLRLQYSHVISKDLQNSPRPEGMRHEIVKYRVKIIRALVLAIGEAYVPLKAY